MSSCVCCGGVACFRWWLGGNCYHRRCFAACRRRVGGLWSQNPRVLGRKGRRRVPFRWLCWSCSACLRVFVVVVWLVFVGGLGGITTIGAALRRVAGVSGVYGRKTPRVVAQSAVDLGGMRVTWGVWGVVDYGLGAVASPCGVAGSARAVLGVFQWVRLLPMSEVVWRGSCSACLRVFVVVVWLVFVGGLGGIATIGAALRRVAGVSGVYGRKTPRVVAQSAVDLGGMRVTWGVWGVVDDGLGALVRGEAFLWCGVSGMSGLSACCGDDRAHCRRLRRGVGAVVGLMGEWWPVRAQAGPLGGGVDGLPGLPLVGLTCAVEGLVLPPDTPCDHLR